MSWRNFEDHKTESREVKKFLVAQGYQDVKVGHGRGTAWGWLKVSISIPRPADCYCHDPKWEEVRKQEMSISCRNCGQEYLRVRREVLTKLMEFAGRNGDYDGNISYNSEWIEDISPVKVDQHVYTEKTEKAIDYLYGYGYDH
jgi:hypothetical protein